MRIINSIFNKNMKSVNNIAVRMNMEGKNKNIYIFAFCGVRTHAPYDTRS